jgi:hypothetical protein
MHRACRADSCVILIAAKDLKRDAEPHMPALTTMASRLSIFPVECSAIMSGENLDFTCKRRSLP